MKRDFDADESEMMDRPQPVSPELEMDLENLGRMNRWFGGHGLVRAFLRSWLSCGRPFRMLDLATGGGDVPRMIVEWARRRGISVTIDAVDCNPATLEIARKRSAEFPEIDFVRADIRNYDNPRTYDIVLCSLALHHFSEEDAVRILRRARSLSHGRVLVSDLERNTVTVGSVWLLTATVFTQAMTKHDARLSAKRAFSYEEFEELVRRAQWGSFSHRRFLPVRQAVWTSAEDAEPVVQIDESALDVVPG